MPLMFLLDENVPARVWRATERHNARDEEILNVVRVGRQEDLPLSSDDSSILLWAQQQDRILITEDKSTMPGHLATHLGNGDHCPGVLMLRPGTSVPELVEFLVLVAYASHPSEWTDRIEYIP